MNKISLFDEAKYMAISAHGTQTYGGFPYFYHLEQVINVLIMNT